MIITRQSVPFYGIAYYLGALPMHINGADTNHFGAVPLNMKVAISRWERHVIRRFSQKIKVGASER